MSKRLRVDIPKSDNLHLNTWVSKTLSAQKRMLLKDFEQSMQSAFGLKNSLITKLQQENFGLQLKVKDLESYIADLKLANKDKVRKLI